MYDASTPSSCPASLTMGGVFSEDVLDALRYVHRRGRRVVSICSGAFVLAAAGLLDGQWATTHWLASRSSPQRYPLSFRPPDVLYVDKGEVLTSAAMARASICACTSSGAIAAPRPRTG